MKLALINLTYLIASVLFILALKGLAHPKTAVKGNLLGALGMFLAVVATLFHQGIVDYKVMFAGIVVGGIIGWVLAVKILMTAMPQLVALFNGLGGGASVLVAGAALIEVASLSQNGGAVPDFQISIATAASGIIGAVTFWGSLVAYAKLQELISGNPITFPGQQIMNLIVLIAAIVVGVIIVLNPTSTGWYWALVAIASVLGILFVIPVGGADMPVVIALLNSYSGLAATATGFVLNNNVLIIAGALVGASGIILTTIMCKAMNRSLTNVLVGAIAEVGEGPSADEVYAGKVKSTSAEEVAMLFEDSQRVVIVPGYGMAVAQAQHALRDLMNELEKRGIEVEFGIHPVAGRMPGHMNVLLAEADIPYDNIKSMDEVNPTLAQTDVVLVVGANDVVNPVARTDTKSPIAGMPILDVDKARTCVVIKRSLSPGFAGIPNPLFAADNTLMFFGDGKKAILALVAAIKEG